MAQPAPEDVALLAEVAEWFRRADTEHKRYVRAWDHFDSLYHNYRALLSAHSDAPSPRDKDAVLGDARKEFGEELHIPYVFSTVETILPRALSNRPKMLFLPRDETAERNVDNVTVVCDAQQQQADYELKLQTTARSGFHYGLGVQKLGWCLRHRDTFQLVPDGQGSWNARPVTVKAFDDPDVEDVDVHDFFWDPFADSMRTMRRCLHRTWRDTGYVYNQIRSGEWGRAPLELADIEASGAVNKYNEAWAGRRQAQGIDGTVSRTDDVHEVWEFHDGQRVVTVLDRQWVVEVIDNPYWHREMPFHAYRPIEVLHRFVGKGIIEPIEDLQRELDWLRTDRRWNAMLKLHQAFAYNDGVVDPAMIKVGPGALVPVNGDPHDLLVPLTVGDIPNSGYQEEAALQADIQRTSGIDDTVAGAGTSLASQTATGVQLVQAAAGLRIQNCTRRLEIELLKPEAQQWLALNQQRIISNRTVRIPMEPTPDEPDRRWAWRQVGPAELAGEFSVDPEGGATAPKNIPQDRQDAMQAMQLFAQVPGVDLRKLALWAMDKMGIAGPEQFMGPPQTVPPQTLDLVKEALVQQAGMKPEMADAILMGAYQTATQQAQNGGPPGIGPPPAGPPNGGGPPIPQGAG